MWESMNVLCMKYVTSLIIRQYQLLKTSVNEIAALGEKRNTILNVCNNCNMNSNLETLKCDIYICIYTYMHIYIYMCVCVYLTPEIFFLLF